MQLLLLHSLSSNVFKGEEDSGSDDNMEYLGILPPAPPTSGVSVARQLLQTTRASVKKQRTFPGVNEQVLPCSQDLAQQKKRKKVCIIYLPLS